MLKERIRILENANIISAESASYVIGVIDELADSNLETGKMEMFTTHLAMATERIIKKEAVDNLDEGIWAEVVKHASYEKASVFYDKMVLKAPIPYPEEEKRFLLMHLCNLFAEE
ncbi:PRD domain-containing protein [Anaerorhabdus sp.]|jgi:hypothetical protein|uniref:PRD domain-containing protein n=1 Tax=Anaerorhabdus sp. TaxID=1872524 RepID=UPI002FC8EB9E